eukprot:RCo019946
MSHRVIVPCPSSIAVDMAGLQSSFLECAVEGRVPVSQLETLLRSLSLSEFEIAEVMASAQQGQADESGEKVVALEELKDMVEHVTSVNRQRSQASPTMTMELNPSTPEDLPRRKTVLAAPFKRLRSLFVRNPTDEIYTGQMRPTNRLIIFVVVMSVVMSLSVAGTAVGLSWTHSLSDHQEALRSEIELAAQAVGSFVGGDRAVKSQGDMASMIGDVVHEVGYNASVETAIGVMLNSVRVMGIIADNLFEITNTHEVAVVAQVLAAVVGRLCTLGHCG